MGKWQLVMGRKTEYPDPEELHIEDVVTCISCGYYHTAYVTGESGGCCKGWGEGHKVS